MELIIDEEFKKLLPSLRDDEKLKLEEDIKRNGVIYPLITWKHCLIDGHNRYEICKANNIPFKTMEVNFTDREDAMVWILKHQLGRRNLSDFDKNRIALQYEEVIARQMKQRQYEGQVLGGKIRQNSACGSIDPKAENTSRRKELAKIAGTSEGSMQRTKLILDKGTPEQIERASRGGKEPDGRSNTIGAIEKEIKGVANTYRCYGCGRILPLSAFYYKADGKWNRECRECNKARCKTKKVYKDFKGNNIQSANISMTEEELKDYLYNKDKEIDYTMDDLLEEMKSNGEKGIKTVETTILIHKELLESEENKQKAMELIATLSNRLNQLNQLIKE